METSQTVIALPFWFMDSNITTTTLFALQVNSFLGCAIICYRAVLCCMVWASFYFTLSLCHFQNGVLEFRVHPKCIQNKVSKIFRHLISTIITKMNNEPSYDLILNTTKCQNKRSKRFCLKQKQILWTRDVVDLWRVDLKTMRNGHILTLFNAWIKKC